MKVVSVVGIDPGPTTGFCFLDYVLDDPQGFGDRRPSQVILFQADGDSACTVLRAMLRDYSDPRVVKRFASVEKFITGRSAGSRGSNAEITRQLVMELTETCQLANYHVKIRAAADVKPWSTDKRLIAAGMKGTAGIHGKSRDAYDGGRQAIYCARFDAFMKDPLERQ